MEEYQRKQLLERIGRDGATVGVTLPESIEIQGEEIDLRSFVFEIKRRDTIPRGERDRVEQAKRNLRRERTERLARIDNNEVSYENGQEIASSIIAIDRALNALEQLDPTDLQAEADRQAAADTKRWMNFLKKALGREEMSGTRGRT
ncbi:DUF5788 family protein [Halalkalirubrum salinum]|uniref:DUF5788 family protein n=1 Tax=Halalkalirubrum salinum TaxID=2563889 RepID=UPI0010FB5928|nr:DUF5788 family protein [Halalkalirubrum salinum]